MKALKGRQPAKVFFASALAAATPLASSKALAGSGFKQLRFNVPQDLDSSEAVALTPFHDAWQSTSSSQRNAADSFALGGFNALADVQKAMNQLSIDAGIEARAIKKSTAFGLRGFEDNSLVRFFTKGLPFCDHEVRAIKQGDEQAAMIGSMPKIDMSYALDADTNVSQSATWDRIVATASQFDVTGNLRPLKWGKCWKIRHGDLQAAWEVWLESGIVLYKAVANADEVFSLNSQMLDVDGKATIYPNSKNDNQLQEFTLHNMTGNGKLDNDYFYVEVDPKSGKTLTEKADLNFTFAPDSDSFIQTSLFTNVNRALDWYQTLGYTKDNFGSVRLRVMAHADFNGDNNNALYKPGVSDPPTILVGDGSKGILQNLGTDRDVVNHEFGHHVIYQTVQDIQGESLVIHEGLADTFTFLKTGSTCLGESICPANSPIGCRRQSDGKLCLRSAENDLAFGSADLPSEPHQRSQFISGMIIDLKKIDGINDADLTKLVYTAVTYLVRNSGYSHLVLALMTADRNLFQGANCDKIYARAQARGLSDKIASFNCSALPALSAVDAVQPNSTPASSSKKRKSGGFCGVVLGGEAQGGLGLLLMLGAPFLWRRRRR